MARTWIDRWAAPPAPDAAVDPSREAAAHEASPRRPRGVHAWRGRQGRVGATRGVRAVRALGRAALVGACVLGGSVVGGSALGGCGGVGMAARTTPSVAATAPPVPSVVTLESYAEVRRAWESLATDDPARAAVRERLVALLAREAEPVMEAGDYDGVVDRLTEIVALFSADELDRGPLPRALRPLATWLMEEGSTHGDEARVLAAYFVLARAGGPDEESARSYGVLRDWGREARSRLPDPIERLTGLLNVHVEHARIIPARSVLDGLAVLYIAHTQLCLEAMRRSMVGLDGGWERWRFSSLQATAIHQAIERLASVHLRIGELSAALARIEVFRDEPHLQAESFIQQIATAREDSPEGNDALLNLARYFMPPARRELSTSRALCLLGRKRAPEDPRFLQCLGRIAAHQRRFQDTAAHYSAARRLAPGERAVYDDALAITFESLTELAFDRVTRDTNAYAGRIDPPAARASVARGAADADARALDALARDARDMLAERLRRFPSTPLRIPAEEQYLTLASAAFGVGDIDTARADLTRSLAIRPTLEAEQTLAMLEAQLGGPSRAAVGYRRALDLIRGGGNEPSAQRGAVLLLLGDALAATGDAAQAERMYREALVAFARAGEHRRWPLRTAMAPAYMGLLHDRLGAHAEAVESFRRSLGRAVPDIDPYFTILTHLLTMPQVDAALGMEVLRATQANAELRDEAQVQLALWGRLLAARAGIPAEPALEAVLGSLARTAGWTGRLAKFGAGRAPYDALLAAAPGPIEQARTHFAEGVRRLAAGDEPGAREAFARTLTLRAVGAEEYEIARRLLALPVGTLLPTPAAAAPAAAAPTAAAPAAAAPTATTRAAGPTVPR